MTPPRLAAAGVDIGTNSVLLTVARPGPGGRLHILDERSVITRLGAGLGQQGALDPVAMERTLTVLEEFGSAVVALDATGRAVGTSALRRAHNADAFLDRAADALGFPVEIVSGVDEARLGYRGALSDLPGVDIDDEPVVVDPGGGSTEVIADRGRRAVSLEVGAVRLTEAFLPLPENDPPRPAALTELVAHVRRVVAPLEPAHGRPIVGVGGTATTLAAVELGLDHYDPARVHGTALELETMRALVARLSALTIAEREAIPCLPPGRADVAVAGGLLLVELISQLGSDRLTVSDRGLRYALIAEIIDAA